MGDLYRLSTRSSLYGVTCVNTFHYDNTVPPNSGTPEADLAERFTTSVLPAWVQCVSASFTIHCIEIVKIGAGVGTPYEKQITADNVGEMAAAALPANRVLCVSEYSGEFTRHGRGRHYFSGIPESQEVDNNVTEDLYELTENFAVIAAGELLGGAPGGTYKRVVYSPTLEQAFPVVKIECSPQVRTLRGRTPRLCG